MPHRGRLNTLANVFHKPLEEIFSEFTETKQKRTVENWGNSGDVKYHLGTDHDKEYNGHKIRLTMLPNPSHLETVDPVVYGRTRAIQDFLEDKSGDKAFGILIHGDAAFSGQGVV